jgi:hypothetical protein
LAGSVPKSIVRDYKAKKDWLENELRRARNVVHRDETPELKKWLERIEKFNRDWFLKFETILHQANVGRFGCEMKEWQERLLKASGC